MKTLESALLLVGSFKRSKSNSYSIGSYLLGKLEEAGVKTNKADIHGSMKSEKKQQELMGLVDGSDLIILSCPLYIDSLPYPVIQFMELTAKAAKLPKEKLFMAIINGGFPESSQSDSAIEICRNFTVEAGFKWAGGLPVGGGGSIDGKPLEKLPGFIRGVMSALDLAAASLSKGESISEEAIALIRKPIMPKWLYILGGNFGWKSKAKKNKVKHRIKDRPYDLL